jgi:hypothetical protein
MQEAEELDVPILTCTGLTEQECGTAILREIISIRLATQLLKYRDKDQAALPDRDVREQRG